MTHPLELRPGVRLRHYKGGEYRVLAVAKHSETLEELVIYQNEKEPDKVWARPRSMFSEQVTVDGKAAPRFSLLT